MKVHELIERLSTFDPALEINVTYYVTYWDSYEGNVKADVRDVYLQGQTTRDYRVVKDGKELYKKVTIPAVVVIDAS